MPVHHKTDLTTGFIYLAHGGETSGQRYQRIRGASLEIMRAPTVQQKILLARENESFLKLRDVGSNVVQDNRFLSNLSVQYGNDEYIGLNLMPDVPAAQLAGQYPIYNRRNRLAAPDDSMVGRSEANEITDSRSKGVFNCQPHALKNHVDVLTLRNQVAPLDEMVDLTEAVSELIALNREIRIATVLTTAANYYAANVQTIAAGSRWDDAGGGNPVLNIQNAIAALWHGRGPSKIYGWCSLDVWNPLSRNEQILDLFKYGGSSPGLATPNMIANFFGLDGIFVSKARQDTANEGQSASYARIWTQAGAKSFGVTRVCDRASLRNAAFGMTLRFGSVETRVWFDPKVSTLGGYYAQVSCHEDHNIQANDAASLIVTPVN
jgi:hypothetical protein